MYEQKETTPAKVEINHFGNWIKSIPVGEYENVKKKIIRDCKITDQIFRHWKCGNSKVPVLAHALINNIAGYDIFKLPDQ